jgi:pyrroline-5-carboxylate reductase
MIDKIIGFIGAGNMGSAMIGGIVHSELVTTSQIIASAHSAATLEKLQSAYSIETTLSNETVAERSDILFLAVKPNKFDEVIPQISSHIKSGCVIVSIAALFAKQMRLPTHGAMPSELCRICLIVCVLYFLSS